MRNQKGFTLVELSIVLVVIGILMAVAIPSFTGTDRSSRIKADTTLVYAYNNILDSGVDTLNLFMSDALNDVWEVGYGNEVFETNSGLYLGWYTEDKRFVIIDTEENICYKPNDKGSYDSISIEEQDRYKYFIACTSPEEGAGYSVYLKPGFTSEEVINIENFSFDCGENKKLDLNFTGNGTEEKDVVILTKGGSLTVDSSNTTITHRGSVREVYLENCKTYREQGSADIVYQTRAQLVIGADSNIGAVCLTVENVDSSNNVFISEDPEGTNCPIVFCNSTRVISSAESKNMMVLKVRESESAKQYEFIRVLVNAEGTSAITDLNSKIVKADVLDDKGKFLYGDSLTDGSTPTASLFAQAVCKSLKNNSRAVKVASSEELLDVIDMVNKKQLAYPLVVLDEPSIKVYFDPSTNGGKTYELKDAEAYCFKDQLVISQPLVMRGDDITVNLIKGLAIEVDSDAEKTVSFSGINFISDKNKIEKSGAKIVLSHDEKIVRTINESPRELSATINEYYEDGVKITETKYTYEDNGLKTNSYDCTEKTYEMNGVTYTDTVKKFSNRTNKLTEYYYQKEKLCVKDYYTGIYNSKHVVEKTWDGLEDKITTTEEGDTVTIVTEVKNKPVSDAGKAATKELPDTTITETVTLQGCTKKVQTVVSSIGLFKTKISDTTEITGRVLLFEQSNEENLSPDAHVLGETWTDEKDLASERINVVVNFTDCSFAFNDNDIVRYNCIAENLDTIEYNRELINHVLTRTRLTTRINADINITGCSFTSTNPGESDNASINLSCDYNSTLEAKIKNCSFTGVWDATSATPSKSYGIYLEDSVAANIESCKFNNYYHAIEANHYDSSFIGEMELALKYNLEKDCNRLLFYEDIIKSTDELPEVLKGTTGTSVSGATLFTLTNGDKMEYNYYLLPSPTP